MSRSIIQPPAKLVSTASVRRAGDAEAPLTLKTARSLARSQVYQSAADAPATLRAYKADLANFKAWCVERNLDPMPSTPEIVGAYLADAGRGYTLSTLRRRVAAIARAPHRQAAARYAPSCDPGDLAGDRPDPRRTSPAVRGAHDRR